MVLLTFTFNTYFRRLGLKIGDEPTMSRSFLESENFEHELGGNDDPFSEDFSEIQRHEIVSHE
jgi:hypothetical protein